MFLSVGPPQSLYLITTCAVLLRSALHNCACFLVPAQPTVPPPAPCAPAEPLVPLPPIPWVPVTGQLTLLLGSGCTHPAQNWFELSPNERIGRPPDELGLEAGGTEGRAGDAPTPHCRFLKEKNSASRDPPN